MAKICIGTDVCLNFLRNKDTWLGEQDPSTLALSAISVFELYAGTDDPKKHKILGEFISYFEILPLDFDALRLAAHLKRTLQKKGSPIAHADLFLAATVISKGCILKTQNKKHFERISGLTVL